MAWNDDLDGNAHRIASSNERIVRVVAGPGTGKTYSLMRRIARLLEEGMNPRRILLVTFTRIAAKDLGDEIEKLDISGSNHILKGTLHAFCFHTLQQGRVLEITGRVPRPLLSFEERFMLEDLSLNDLGSINNIKRLQKAFEAAWAREQDQTPGWPEREVDRRFQHSLEDWLRFHKSILIGELIPITLGYIRNNSACQERYRFDHVFVDEYQDLNKAEQTLIDYLSNRGSLTVIGDEDQSIYENFRFAHPEGISQFLDTHPGTEDIPLNLCRRCPKKVVSIANNLIQNNFRRSQKTLNEKVDNPTGDITIVQWPDLDSEVVGVSNYLHQKISCGEFDPGKTLIITSRRLIGYKIKEKLNEFGIAAHSFFHEEALDGNPKKKGCYQAQQALTLLNLIRDRTDSVSLRCWLGFGSPTLRNTQYQKLKNYCSSNNISPVEALELINTGQLKINKTKGLLARYRLFIDVFNQLPNLKVEDIFNNIFPSGFEWSEPIRQMIQANVTEWTLENIYDVIRSNIIQPELPIDVDYVRIMSFYKSKGLNADHVVVTGLLEGLIPTLGNQNLSHDEEQRLIEEQRRLFYVAITRPKLSLVLSNSRTLPRNLAHKMGARFGSGNHQLVNTLSSRFLAELGPQSPDPINGPSWNF